MTVRTRLGLGALGVLLAASGTALAQEKPRDDASMVMEVVTGQDIAATDILSAWAKHFDALVIPDPQIQPVKIRFLTNTNAPMTWGAMKSILDFHDVVVVESQPTPSGPWVIRAHHRRNLAQKEGPPWRYVKGDDLPDHEELVTAVFQIKNGAGQQIFATVRGLLTRDTNRIGNILFVQGPEVLIIVDLASKVRYYRRVIEALDVAGPRKQMKIYQVSFAPVQDLANVLSSVIQTLGGQGPGGGAPGQQPVVVAGRPGQAGAGGTQVIADQRTNQLIVAAFPIDFPLIEDVVSALDVRVAAPSGRFHVYKCQNADAADLAAKVQELFTGQAAPRPGSGGTNQAGAPPGGAPRPRPTAATLSESTGVGEVETRIVADEQTNSILIQAEERAYNEILDVLSQLDRKRRRVMIEAEVWEISTPQDNMTIQIELAGLTNAHDGSVRPAAGTAYGLSTITPVEDEFGDRLARTPVLNQGLTAVLTKDTFDKLPIILNALGTFTEAKLVTRPFALTNDNTPATFAITDRIPFQTTTQGGQGFVSTNVDFADASSTLTIEPQVNSEENLTLKLNLEITSFRGDSSGGLPPPSNTRSYEGEVTVPNGTYVVFGGLEQEIESTTERKVPFLGDIPILGHLFKSWSSAKTKTKIYIFIRPTIFAKTNFEDEKLVGQAMRARAHVLAERDDWLPPIVPDRLLRGVGYTLQDEAFDLFGTGSANPFDAGATTLITSGD
jgi:general secretion pathway protein D